MNLLDHQIKKLRKEIDIIDKKIIMLLDERFEIVKRIGVIKKRLKLPITDKKREKEILTKVNKISFNYSKQITKLYTHIIKLSKGIER
ncbi:MAG: chorismate mutase [Elusimicrobiales bacterium]